MAARRHRSSTLRRLSAAKRHDYYQEQVGREAIVLIEDIKDGNWPGYTENYVRVLIHSDLSDLANRLARVSLRKVCLEYVEAEILEVLD